MKQMYADHAVRVLVPELGRDERPPIAPGAREASIAELFHQLDPEIGRFPPVARRLAADGCSLSTPERSNCVRKGCLVGVDYFF
jgi:hypothetical protein